jgi:hypothetical protein
MKKTFIINIAFLTLTISSCFASPGEEDKTIAKNLLLVTQGTSAQGEVEEIQSQSLQADSQYGGYFAFQNMLGGNIKTGKVKHWTPDWGKQTISLDKLQDGKQSLRKHFITSSSNTDRWSFTATLEDGSIYYVNEKESKSKILDAGKVVILQAIWNKGLGTLNIIMPDAFSNCRINYDYSNNKKIIDSLQVINDINIIEVSAVGPQYFPTENRIQGSGSCLSSLSGIAGLGTLGVRVIKENAPNTAYYYITAGHNFKSIDDQYKWGWVKGEILLKEPAGTVIDKAIFIDPETESPWLDAALIQMYSKELKSFLPGVFNVTNKVLGTRKVNVGDRVVKYGMTTGYTYGVVVSFPTSWHWTRHMLEHVFAVQRTDRDGNKISSGGFSEPGDSGAPVMLYSNTEVSYVTGMISFGKGIYTIVDRIEQIENFFKVKVYTNP